MLCPLCQASEVVDYHRDKRRPYHQCQVCHLVFVDPAFHLSNEEEKAEYDKHENQLDDPGYITFLSRLLNPVLSKIKPGSSGLDMGCGPAPALAQQFELKGHNMNVYDLYYFDNPAVLEQKYDFVTCSEVIEHIAQPAAFIERLLSLLKPGAPLGLMTKLVISPERFAIWHYKNDPTHISFFSRETFEYIAQTHELDIEFVGQDVILLNKAATT